MIKFLLYGRIHLLGLIAQAEDDLTRGFYSNAVKRIIHRNLQGYRAELKELEELIKRGGRR